jgi:hypothetical protein
MDGTNYMIDLARGQFASADAAKNPVFLFHCFVLSSTAVFFVITGPAGKKIRTSNLEAATKAGGQTTPVWNVAG